MGVLEGHCLLQEWVGRLSWDEGPVRRAIEVCFVPKPNSAAGLRWTQNVAVTVLATQVWCQPLATHIVKDRSIRYFNQKHFI